MKYFIYILAGLLIFGGIAFAMVFVFKPQTQQQQPTQSNSNPFGDSGDVQSLNPGTGITPPAGQTGGASGTTKTATLTGSDGSVIEVRDFGGDSDVIADPYNKGIYYLGYHSFDASSSPANVSAPFYVQYQAPTQMFVISLNQEPISQTRQQAEQYLMSKLNLTQDKMCHLRYSIAVPYFVNQYYAGENLGFSFCPGAVQLPQ